MLRTQAADYWWLKLSHASPSGPLVGRCGSFGSGLGCKFRASGLLGRRLESASGPATRTGPGSSSSCHHDLRCEGNASLRRLGHG